MISRGETRIEKWHCSDFSAKGDHLLCRHPATVSCDEVHPFGASAIFERPPNRILDRAPLDGGCAASEGFDIFRKSDHVPRLTEFCRIAASPRGD
jgi:hypothetical protein